MLRLPSLADGIWETNSPVMITAVFILAALVVLVATDSATEAHSENRSPVIAGRCGCKRFFSRGSRRTATHDVKDHARDE